MAKRHSVAVIGAGDMGGCHVEGWQLAGHDVVSVCDIDTVRATQLADKFGIARTVQNYEEAVSDTRVDIVSVCVPLDLHERVTIAAASHGKHVFCEKPIARSLAEIDRMEAAVAKAGVEFGIGFQRNLANGIRQLRQWVQDDVFGKPLLFNSELLQEVRPKRFMHDAQGNMGPIVDACCHDFLVQSAMISPVLMDSRTAKLKDKESLASAKP